MKRYLISFVGFLLTYLLLGFIDSNETQHLILAGFTVLLINVCDLHDKVDSLSKRLPGVPVN